jgi:hypothetical protein
MHVIDIEICGNTPIWRHIHRIGFFLALIALILSLSAALGNGIVGPDKTGLDTLKWAMVSLSLGASLLSVSSFFYRRVTVKQR